MDTLAGLMAPDPQFIEPWLLAESRETLTGELELSAMPRLHELLAGDQGRAEYQLLFGKDAQGITCVLGRFSVNLRLYCQRCLTPIACGIERRISVGVVATQEEAGELPDEYEPLHVSGSQLSLLNFIEDEILLALPMAPVHAVDECPSGIMVEKFKPQTETPFAKLKELKIQGKP